MENQNLDKEKQDKIGVWIGVSILIIVGMALLVYGVVMATNPGAEATMLFGNF